MCLQLSRSLLSCCSRFLTELDTWSLHVSQRLCICCCRQFVRNTAITKEMAQRRAELESEGYVVSNSHTSTHFQCTIRSLTICARNSDQHAAAYVLPVDLYPVHPCHQNFSMNVPPNIQEQGLILQQLLTRQHACNTQPMSCHAILLGFFVKPASLQRGFWQTWLPKVVIFSFSFLKRRDSAKFGRLAPVL